MGIHDRQRRPRQVDSRVLDPERLIGAAATPGQDDTAERGKKRKRKKKRAKSPGEREKRGGGAYLCVSSSHKGVFFGLVRVSRTAPLSSLLLGTVLHGCASVSELLPPFLRRRVKPPIQSGRGKASARTRAHTHQKSFFFLFPPPQPSSLSLTPRTGGSEQIRGVHTVEAVPLLAAGGTRR